MKTIKIWDNFTRLYHLSQLVLLALLWYSAEQADFELHFSCAFILLGLWLSRIIWGFFGSETSRFTHFIKSPIQLFKSFRTPLSKTRYLTPSIGHNPIAGYMILALLISLGVQLFSGLFASDDVFSEGPLYMLVSESFAQKMDSLHHNNFDILLVFIGLHAIAAIVHVFNGDNVIKAILTGKKTVNKQTLNEKPKAKLTFRSSWLPLVVWLGLASALYYWGMGAASY